MDIHTWMTLFLQKALTLVPSMDLVLSITKALKMSLMKSLTLPLISP